MEQWGESPRVFLGGASGRTTWRRDVAVPALEAAGIGYFNPQLGVGEWTAAREEAEMRAKAEAEVLLFVLNGETRGVATVAEVAYYLAQGRRLALMVVDVGESDVIEDQRLAVRERDDLNRGRIFVRTMAREHGVPVFSTVADTVQHAIELIRQSGEPMSAARLRSILAEVRFGSSEFLVTEMESGFLIQMAMEEACQESGELRRFVGRRWFVERTATVGDVVRTAMKAVLTWQEHEAREGFRYREAKLFGPHGDVGALAAWHRRK